MLCQGQAPQANISLLEQENCDLKLNVHEYLKDFFYELRWFDDVGILL